MLPPSWYVVNTLTTVEAYPEGYPQLAAFANSCDTFANVRRFGRLSYRLLAHLQHDLTEMEKALDELDNKDASDETMEHRLRGFEHYDGWNDEQRKLLSKISGAYTQYGIYKLFKIRGRTANVIAS